MEELVKIFHVKLLLELENTKSFLWIVKNKYMRELGETFTFHLMIAGMDSSKPPDPE